MRADIQPPEKQVVNPFLSLIIIEVGLGSLNFVLLTNKQVGLKHKESGDHNRRGLATNQR